MIPSHRLLAFFVMGKLLPDFYKLIFIRLTHAAQSLGFVVYVFLRVIAAVLINHRQDFKRRSPHLAPSPVPVPPDAIGGTLHNATRFVSTLRNDAGKFFNPAVHRSPVEVGGPVYGFCGTKTSGLEV